MPLAENLNHIKFQHLDIITLGANFLLLFFFFVYKTYDFHDYWLSVWYFSQWIYTSTYIMSLLWIDVFIITGLNWPLLECETPGSFKCAVISSDSIEVKHGTFFFLGPGAEKSPSWLRTEGQRGPESGWVCQTLNPRGLKCNQSSSYQLRDPQIF